MNVKLLLTSLIKILLIAGAVTLLAFVLVKGGQIINEKPVIENDADGAISLNAADAEILGVGEARFNVHDDVENIGWWDNVEQFLRWRVKPAAGGSYEVKLKYSLPPDKETEFELAVIDQKLNCKIPATGGWDKWLEAPLGKITLTADEIHSITVKPLKITGDDGVMNLCWLKLSPVTP